jgi:hypothetical protein
VETDVRIVCDLGGGGEQLPPLGRSFAVRAIVALFPGSYAGIYVSWVHLEDIWNKLLITSSLDLIYS